MELAITYSALAAGLAVVGLMSWLERRPRKGLNPPLVPTTPVFFAGMLVAVLAFVHLLNLSGIHTGR